MRMIFPLMVAGVLVLIAWPVLDAPAEPALAFIDAHQSNWPVQRAAWVGDDEKRNAIIMSAVWVPGDQIGR